MLSKRVILNKKSSGEQKAKSNKILCYWLSVINVRESKKQIVHCTKFIKNYLSKYS